MTEIECVAHSEDVLGEVPVWCPREQALYWIDAFKPAIHRYQPDADGGDLAAQAVGGHCGILSASIVAHSAGGSGAS